MYFIHNPVLLITRLYNLKILEFFCKHGRPFEEGIAYDSICVKKPTGNSGRDGLERRETRDKETSY